MQQVDLLILGAGWTSTFLLPLLKQRNYSFAATTTDGRKVADTETIKWRFEPPNDDNNNSSSSSSSNEKNDKTGKGNRDSIASLPLARHVLITFPLTSAAQTDFLVTSYLDGHPSKHGQDTRFIQLGSSGIWQIPQSTIWVSRRSPYNTGSARAIAEDALLKRGGCVLNLAGLWGGERDPRNWVARVAKTKEEVKGKKSLHLVHGADVARGVVAVMRDWSTAGGERWMVTDGIVYDWWELFVGWAAEGKGEKVDGDGVEDMPSDQARWVFELMKEERVWALPRSMEHLGRCYFGREFWDAFKLAPLKARV